MSAMKTQGWGASEKRACTSKPYKWVPGTQEKGKIQFLKAVLCPSGMHHGICVSTQVNTHKHAHKHALFKKGRGNKRCNKKTPHYSTWRTGNTVKIISCPHEYQQVILNFLAHQTDTLHFLYSDPLHIILILIKWHSPYPASQREQSTQVLSNSCWLMGWHSSQSHQHTAATVIGILYFCSVLSRFQPLDRAESSLPTHASPHLSLLKVLQLPPKSTTTRWPSWPSLHGLGTEGTVHR